MANIIVTADNGTTATVVTSIPATFMLSGGLIGPTGEPGTNGVGLPIGGSTGQILSKLTNNDYDFGWVDSDDFAKRTTRFIVAPFGDTRAADYICTTATTNEVEIMDAIIAANALPQGGVVELLDGVFTVSDTIRILPNVWVKGQGMTQTKIQDAVGSADIDIFSADRAIYNGTNPLENGVISHMELDGSNLDTSSSFGKGIDAVGLINFKVFQLYVHDTVATGIGLDDFRSGTITECLTENCGYNNKRILTAASWLSSTYTFTTSTAHDYTAGVKATGTLTSTGAVNDGDTVVIPPKTYTFKTILTGAAYEILINGSAANALINLKKAINLTGVAGTDYGLSTFKHTTVAASTITATTLQIDAINYGTGGNAIATTDTGSNIAFGAATLTGGANADRIVVTGMLPMAYNGIFNVTSIVDPTTFTVGTANNSGIVNITADPGTATQFGLTADALIGHNGIGIASGELAEESIIVTNNYSRGNLDNNYLIEVNDKNTGQNSSVIFSNNVSVLAGNSGFRNTGTLNVQFNNNFDYGSLYGLQLAGFFVNAVITNISWSAGIATVTTSGAHTFRLGEKVTIDKVTPTGYNGYFTILTAPTTTSFTVAIANDPGAVTDLDAATAKWIRNGMNGTQIINNIFAYNNYNGLLLGNLSEEVMIKNNTIKYCQNVGITGTNTNNLQIQGNEIHHCGRQGIMLGSSSYTTASHIDISGNTVWSNGRNVANTYDGIDIDPGTTAPLSHVTLRGNRVYDDQDTKTQRYGVILRSGGLLSNISVDGGDLSGNLTAGILVQETGDTIYVNNVGGVNSRGRSSLGSVSGSVTFDNKLADVFKLTATGNITAVMSVSLVDGARMIWIVAQDATGSRTLTLPANAAPGATVTLSTSASSVDILEWVYDLAAVKWRLVNRELGTSAAARVNLGVVIGSDVQAFDTDLTTIAGLTATTDNFLVSVASAWASRTPAQVRTTLGLVIGTNVQAWDADLDTWATKTAPSGTVIGTTDTQTLTNKRVTARISTTASSGTPTPNADTDDEYTVTALAADATFGAPTGTPTEGQKLIIRIKDNGTSRALAWNAIYRAVGITLPTATAISKTLYVGCIYNNTDTKWDVVSTAQEA